MNTKERKELNRRVGCLRNSVLKLNEEDYRAIVSSVDEKSGGFVRNCDDEHANLVLLTLQRMADRRSAKPEIQNSKQHRQIARLMDYLKWNWTATAKFCFHQTGKRTTRQCTAAELSKVIIGMVRIIDADIERGKLVLSAQELTEYRRHTPCGEGRTTSDRKTSTVNREPMKGATP